MNTNLFLQVSSTGIIDTNLLRIIGFSTKRGDETQFGHFGSGVKYSMALLIRNNIPFKLYNGLEEIAITTKEHELYSKDGIFKTHTILINGIDTSISTEIGPDWEPWMILRELISNAKDQDPKGCTINVVLDPQPVEGAVTWIIDLSKHTSLLHALKTVYKETPDITTAGTYNALYFKDNPQDKPILYVKGFNAGVINEKKTALFHVGGDSVSIDERRIHRNFYEWQYGIQLVQLTDKQLIHKVLEAMGDPNTIEYSCLDYGYGSVNTYISQEFVEVLGTVKMSPLTLKAVESFYEDNKTGRILYVTQATYNSFREYLSEALIQGEKGQYRELTIQPGDEKFWSKIDQAMIIIGKHYPAIYSYEIRIVRFVEQNVYGTIDSRNRWILLSDRIIIEPDKQEVPSLISLILEEFFHIEYNFEDCSRKLQNFLFSLISQHLYEHTPVAD